ncbi:MAG TPA: insulinase family protein [Chlamydiales bacterium]|nr:insulinase family protein [Chlamydiales bacterium]
MDIGDQYHGFSLVKKIPLEEIKATYIELEHNVTQAKVIHIENDDMENVFSISFQTCPSDSTGVAHILEHTVLCGSKKFPVKDPFFSMLRRSMNTFMNAFTGSDFTCYPAASQIEEDFYNLLSVYIDATFFPLLKPLSFAQEGHRLAFENPTDSSSDLVYKGVVFNEMKGAMASSDYRLYQTMMAHLTPDLTYHHNSGGEPKEIPTLSYEQLQNFHKLHYAPSNALFFFYGNIPTEKHLLFLDQNLLKEATRTENLPPIPVQKRFTHSKTVQGSFPKSPYDDKDMIAFGFLTCSIKDQEELLALQVLDDLLMDHDGSLLKKELLNSKLITTADAYLDTEMSEIPYIIVCKGCEKKAEETLLEIIQKTLKTIIKNGIDPTLIETALHQIEFSRSEISSDDMPYGLSLFMRSALLKQHGALPEQALQIHSLFKSLKEKFKDPNYIKHLIEKHLLNNTHFIKLTMIPSESLNQEEELEEKKRLKNIQKNLTEDQKKQIIEKNLQLEAFQKELETSTIDCLPKLDLSHIPPHVKKFEVQSIESSNAIFYHHDTFTNNILYLDLELNLPNIATEDLPYLSFFASIFGEIDTKSYSYEELLKQISAYTGGIDAHIPLYPNGKDFNQIKPSFAIRSKALYRNGAKLIHLLYDLIENINFSNENRLLDLIKQQHTIIESSLTKNPLSYAKAISAKSHSIPAMLQYHLYSVPYLHFLRKYKDPKMIPSLIQKLSKLKAEILKTGPAHIVITCEKSYLAELEKNHFYELNKLSLKNTNSTAYHYELSSTPHQSYILPIPVSFSAYSVPTIPYLHEKAPAIMVASELFENITLHKEIREKGGAYGSGAKYNPLFGTYTFYSFRDPHIASTYEAFLKACKMISERNFTKEDLEEAKLCILQDLESPISPGSRALYTYAKIRSDISDANRREVKNKILSITEEEVISAIQEYILPNFEKGTFVTFGNENLINNETKKLPIKIEISIL